MEEKNNHKSEVILCLGIIGAILFIVFVGLLFFRQGNSNNLINSQGVTCRNAQNYDISYTRNDNYLTRVAINIKPKQDIDNLIVRVSFYTGNNELLTQKDRNMGNVEKDIQEVITFPLSEFSLSNLWEINKFNVVVIGGTIDLTEN